MTRREINEEYFQWLCELVSGGVKPAPFRCWLLQQLHHTDFFYTIPKDANRFEDGVNLRYRFGNQYDIDQRLIMRYLDDRNCSVLEMMVALCDRCEQQIMSNADIGDRTGKWFEEMLDSLGLSDIDEEDENAVSDILERFMNHEYEPNGKGGLFTIEHGKRDMCSAEIWYQAMWYLNGVLGR